MVTPMSMTYAPEAELPMEMPLQPPVAEAPVEEKKPELDEAGKAYVKSWEKRIIAAKKHHKPAFDRMRLCMQVAKSGGSKEWVGKEDDANGRYVVPVIKRHINQAVSQLYAKNPKSFAERKRRRMGTVWDDKLSTLQEAAQILQQGAQVGIQDPNAMAIVADAAQVQQYIKMMDGLADTLNLLFDYYLNEQAAGYKQRFKAEVRRTKVCGVAYATLDYQRVLEKRPEITGKINDATDQVAAVEQLMREAARDDIDEDNKKMEELKRTLADLQAQEHQIVREGPVLGFPKSTSIIIDPACTHLKTLTGAGWWAEEYDMDPDEIETIYKVDVRKEFKKYSPDKDAKPRWSDAKGDSVKDDLAKVWKVQHKPTGLEFVICEGYCGYLKEPTAPSVKIERFFTLFPLVFNEIEDEDEIFPPSDVWDARHTQQEWNSAREGLREHRRQNKPGYYSPTGALQDADKSKLSNRVSGEIVEVGALSPGDRLEDKLAPIKTVPIDPNLYEVSSLQNDFTLVLGAQQAQMGSTSGDTATETSIAENSRMVADSSSVDDLDDHLSEIARSMGQLMLLELTKETVVEIVGPGAVWPDMPQTREEIAKDLTLDIKAGSSGRPNRTAELANIERGMPFIVQLPGVNPTPIAEQYLDLLEIDAKDRIVEGMPSITALNAMMTKASGMQPGTGDPATDPNAQGAEGGNNAAQPAGTAPGPQPAFPAPMAGTSPGNQGA